MENETPEPARLRKPRTRTPAAIAAQQKATAASAAAAHRKRLDAAEDLLEGAGYLVLSNDLIAAVLDDEDIKTLFRLAADVKEAP